jgi:hypothetical protein
LNSFSRLDFTIYFFQNYERVEKRICKEREEIVKTQLLNRGITNENILKAFLEVPREKFVSGKINSTGFRECSVFVSPVSRFINSSAFP